jgi:hypothetical protein
MLNKKIEKILCETIWHEEIELDKEFQECPICKSIAYHKHIIINQKI